MKTLSIAVLVSFLSGLLSFTAVAIAEDKRTKINLLQAFLRTHEWGWGEKKAVWLKKNNAFREWEEVAVVFGYVDNMSACGDLERGLREVYPSAKFICEFVN